MTTWIEIQRRDGIDRRNVTPGDGAGTAEGACPGCGTEPFLVRGGNMTRLPDDRTYRAGGRCVSCNDPVGYIYWRTNTIFGLEEDEAVLEHGRARVY